MKSWAGYFGHFFQSALFINFSFVERVLLVAFVLALAISAVDAQNGEGVGNSQQIKLAKLRAQQELMAQRTLRN